jgi:replication fork clamp-binding protein CrfC
MLKRHQVLLTDWQTEYLKDVAKKNDISFSEAIRQHINGGIRARLASLSSESSRSKADFEARKMAE